MYCCPEVLQEVEWCWWELLVAVAVAMEVVVEEAAVANSLACLYLY